MIEVMSDVVANPLEATGSNQLMFCIARKIHRKCSNVSILVVDHVGGSQESLQISLRWRNLSLSLFGTVIPEVWAIGRSGTIEQRLRIFVILCRIVAINGAEEYAFSVFLSFLCPIFWAVG